MDFDALVIAPNMAAFAIAVVIDPLVSQPGATPYAASGIFASRTIDIAMEAGGVLSDQKTTLDVQLSDFVMHPRPRAGDKITILNSGRVYFVADIGDDGQGARQLTLREEAPENFRVG